MRHMKEKISKNKNRIKNKISLLIVILYIFLSNQLVYAETKDDKGAVGTTIASSKFGTGTKNLFTDLSTYLLILSPTIGAVFGVYFFIRKNAADEQDQKQWNKRLITTGICVVGAVLVSSMIKVFTGYYE